MDTFPAFVEQSLDKVHPSWVGILRKGIAAVVRQTPTYFSELASAVFLPTQNRLFAAFSIPYEKVRYVLVGEGPYPREASASGYCFMDGAVDQIWSDDGLAKPVNKAVSLRNFIKMQLVADGLLTPGDTGKAAMACFVQQHLTSGHGFITTLPQLQANMLAKGFLLLNASLVFRKGVAAAKETRYWQPFIDVVLKALADKHDVTLILWGRLAERYQADFEKTGFEIAASEHPYNLSFIDNAVMQDLFRPLLLLKKA